MCGCASWPAGVAAIASAAVNVISCAPWLVASVKYCGRCSAGACSGFMIFAVAGGVFGRLGPVDKGANVRVFYIDPGAIGSAEF